MSHNPILKRLNLGFFDRFTVEKGTVAVLFKNQRFEREAGPGERISNVQAEIVDTAPQTLIWRVELPSTYPNDFFSFTFTLRYAVADPRRMVEDSVADTEALLTRVLEQKLRGRSRDYTLNQHKELERAMADLLGELDLPTTCGLQFLEPPDIVISLSEPAQARIKELIRLQKAMSLPQTTRHEEALPSSEHDYGFKVTVDVQYRVTNPAEVPYDTLTEAEQQLWPKLKRRLSRASRQYKVVQIAQAENAMQDALDDLLDGDGVREFGLEVRSADVSTELDETARKRYAELAEIQHATAMETYRLSGLKENTAFFADLIKQGSWAVLATAVVKGEVSIQELYQRMSQAEQDRFRVQVELLKTLRAENSRDEAQDWRVSQTLLDAVVGQTLRPTAPGLAAPESTPQITDGNAPGSSGQ